MKRNPLFSQSVVLLALGGCLVSASAAPLELVSAASSNAVPTAVGGGDSWNSLLTPDGRFVLFASTANNLVSPTNGGQYLAYVPPKMNVFLRDRARQTTTLLTVNFAGTAGGNGDSMSAGISTNGRYALFVSSASDLVPNDTNNAGDVFVRDTVSGQTILVSVSTNGGCGNGDSQDAVMTPDGRYVAFSSLASNLVPNDTNGIADVFVRDLQTGVTVLASAGAMPTAVGSPYGRVSGSESPVITPDGRYVAFLSTAINLVPGVDTIDEIYVRDLWSHTTRAVSAIAHDLLTGPLVAYNHVISDDGQYVVFEANSATNLAAGVIFRHDLQTGASDIVSTNAVAATSAYKYCQSLGISPDGRFVSFIGITNTGPDTSTSCAFLWDGQTGATALVGADRNGAVPTNSDCRLPIVDASGRYVSFLSTATNLTTNVVEGDDFHLYVRDVEAGATQLVDVGTNGVGSAKGIINEPGLTANGRFISFDCTDANIVPNDNNRAYDVFERDLASNSTELISVRAPALPSTTPLGSTGAGAFAVNNDGRYVAFTSNADDLADNDTNGLRDIYVHDLMTGSNILVSVNTNGVAPESASGWVGNPYYGSLQTAISRDGRYAAFISTADSLVPGVTGRVENVFERDLQSGTTSLVSVSTNGINSGDGDSFLLSLSRDGRYVLFESQAQNLAANLQPGSPNLFVRDMRSAVATALTKSNYWVEASMSLNGMVAFTTSPVIGLVGGISTYLWDPQSAALSNLWNAFIDPQISPDSRRLAYYSYGDDSLNVMDLATKTNVLVSPRFYSPFFHVSIPQYSEDGRFLVYVTGDKNAPTNTYRLPDIYLFDYQTGTNTLISRSYNSEYSANGVSDSPTISPDGRFIAYRSRARNIVPGVVNGSAQIYLYDRQTGETVLLAGSALGAGRADQRAFSPVFSGDSQTLVFRSWDPNLVPRDFNQDADLFSLKLYSTNPTPAFVGQIVFAPTSGRSPTLTWPATPGTTYQVQFKDNLTDPQWQPLNGSVTIVGDHGYATDFAPSPCHRFYRIVAF